MRILLLLSSLLLVASFVGTALGGGVAEQPEQSAEQESRSPIKQPGLPLRPRDAVGGSALIGRIERLSLDEREAIILREITAGNFPEFLRHFRKVPLSWESPDGKLSTASIEVMCDYLSVGSDCDFVRIPLTPQTAQQIADRLGCVLPTRKIVDAIDRAAELRLEPRPLTTERESVTTFFKHHQIIESQRAGHPLGKLVTGIKKDVVLSPRIFDRPQRLAIYGWRKLDGQPIQNLTTVHVNRYVDYSHGIRLVSRTIDINGQLTDISDLLRDSIRWRLVSDEGPMDPPRYPSE